MIIKYLSNPLPSPLSPLPPHLLTHMHTQKGRFSVYARVPPIDILKLDPNAYRVLVGVVELACVGAILLLEPRLQVRQRLTGVASQATPFLFLSIVSIDKPPSYQYWMQLAKAT